MESTAAEINSLIQDGILLVNDDTLVPDVLLNYESHELDLIQGKMLLEIATDFRDKCEFTAILTQIIRTVLYSEFIKTSLDIDSERATSLILTQFNKKHKFFINWFWEFICGTGLWPVIKFTLSIGLSISLSRKS